MSCGKKMILLLLFVTQTFVAYRDGNACNIRLQCAISPIKMFCNSRQDRRFSREQMPGPLASASLQNCTVEYTYKAKLISVSQNLSLFLHFDSVA